MKIRMKGNSIRYRLTKTDVAALATNGLVEEQTQFGTAQFKYVLKSSLDTANLMATYVQDCITVFIPENWIIDWPTNNRVGFESHMPLPNQDSLFILIEKDFICLDHPTENQEDHYPHPNKTC